MFADTGPTAHLTFVEELMKALRLQIPSRAILDSAIAGPVVGFSRTSNFEKLNGTIVIPLSLSRFYALVL